MEGENKMISHLELTINAYGVDHDSELNFDCVGLYVQSEGGDILDGFEFQRAISFDSQDISLGMDTYCTTNSSERTLYGKIAECKLNNNALIVRFESDGAEIMGYTSIHFHLVLSEFEKMEVLSGLKVVFGDDCNTPVMNF